MSFLFQDGAHTTAKPVQTLKLYLTQSFLTQVTLQTVRLPFQVLGTQATVGLPATA